MKTDLEAPERQFLESLQRLGGGTVQAIGDAIGVTATAVRQRLNRLQGLGYISREVRREGRGRPHHEYRVTEKGMRILGDNYNDLALILWRQIQTIPDEQIREQLRQQVRDALVAQYGKLDALSSLEDRLRYLQAGLTVRGYSVEVTGTQGLPVLREHNCPYSELAESDRSICELEQDVFEKVLGVPVRLTRCCQDEHSCCEFEVGRSPGPETVSATG